MGSTDNFLPGVALPCTAAAAAVPELAEEEVAEDAPLTLTEVEDGATDVDVGTKDADIEDVEAEDVGVESVEAEGVES